MSHGEINLKENEGQEGLKETYQPNLGIWGPLLVDILPRCTVPG